MSPAELWVEFEADRERRLRQLEIAMVTAWQTVNLGRRDPKKKLPSLRSLLKDLRSTSGRQTTSELRQALKTLSGLYGIPLTKATRRTHG